MLFLFALSDEVPDPAEADIGRAVPGPVDDPGLAADLFPVDEAPEAGIVGFVAVVAHDEVFSRRHGDGAEIVPAGLDGRARVLDVGFVELLSVAVDFLVAHFEHVARDADDALDEVLGRVLGILEDDDVAGLGIGERQDDLVGEGDMGAVEEFVDEQMVADQQRVKHGARRDLEGLDHEGADDQGQDQGHGQGFQIFQQQFLPSRIHRAIPFGVG